MVYLIILGWFALGMLGLFLLRHTITEGNDLRWTNGDTVFAIIFSVFGPVALIYGVIWFTLCKLLDFILDNEWFNR